MAEALAVVGIVASIVQLADFGAKLSIKLFAFSQTAASAGDNIKAISNDVSLTSTVLRELSVIITTDRSNVISPAAVQVTQQTVTECVIVFEQFEQTLNKCLGGVKDERNDGKDGKEKKGMGMMDKLKWPFRQPKMELLRSNLDRLKASLSLMLQVLSYARDIGNQKTAETAVAYQQHVIETLARSQKDSERRYQSLLRSIEDHDKPPPPFHTLIVDPAESSDVSRTREPVTRPPVLTPVNKVTRSLVRRMLFCFELIDKLLDQQFAQRQRSELRLIGYDKLLDVIDSIKLEEQKRLPLPTLPEGADTMEKMKAIQSILEVVESSMLEINPTWGGSTSTLPEAEEFVGGSPLSSPGRTKMHPSTVITSKLTPEVKTSAPQKNADGIEIDKILLISQRGERLNALQDKPDNLAISAQGFRRGANRGPKPGVIMKTIISAGESAGESINWIGGEAYKGMQVLGKGIERLSTSVIDAVTQPAMLGNDHLQGKNATLDAEDADVSDGEDQTDIVADLMARWTLLPQFQQNPVVEEGAVI